MDQESLKRTIIDFLHAHTKAVFATIGDDEHPATSLMLYAADDDLNVYFGTRRAFGKYKTLMRHPFISLSVVEEGIDPLRVVEIRGKAEFITPEKTAETLAWFTAKNPSTYYVKDAEDFIMFVVKPAYIRWHDASSGELHVETLSL